MRKTLLCLILMLFLTTAAYAQDDADSPLHFTFEDLDRTYDLHVPEQLTEPAPLVLVLHGRGGDGRGVEDLTAFDAVADAEGFLVAYPDAVDGEWNFIRDVPGYDDNHDDLAFLVALVDHIAETQSVDLERVYIAGFSNGGFMAQRAACEDPSRFAAFASVAATGFGGMLNVCQEPGNVTAPMLLMHGTKDNNIPWEGMSVTQGSQTVFITYPVSNTLAYWAEFNACQPAAETTDLPQFGPDTYVQVMTIDCPEDASVQLYAIVGGGHNWPGQAEGSMPELFGNISHDINASEVIWEFFSAHHRPQGE